MCKEHYEIYAEQFSEENRNDLYADLPPISIQNVPNITVACDNGFVYMKPFIIAGNKTSE